MRTLIIATVLCFIFSISYTETNIKQTGTFSNLQYHKEAGDLLGFEIRVVLTRNGYEGTFQAAEGGPGSLVLLREITIKDNTIKFVIPKSSTFAGEFMGKLEEVSLKGTLTLRNGNKITLTLERRRSYWD